MTDEYIVKIAPAAGKELRKLKDKKALKAVGAFIDSLKKNPRPRGVEKLKDTPNMWRYRVGDFRVMYAIREKVVIIVLGVKDRKEAYKDIDQLFDRLARVDSKALAKEIQLHKRP